MSLVLIVSSVTAIGFPRISFRLGGYAFLAGTLFLMSPFIVPISYPRMYDNQIFVCKKGFLLPSDTTLEYIGNLGRGFIEPQVLNELQEFRAYLDKNGNDYAGYDSDLAKYCILGSENHFKYQTEFNMEGIEKQNDTIKRIETDHVNTMVMNLYGSQLYYLQIRLFERGFYPDAILDNKYLILKRRQKDQKNETEAVEVVLGTPGIHSLRHLPQAWASACASLTEAAPLPYELTWENCVRTEQGGFVSPKDGSVVMSLHFKEPISARDLQFLLLSARTGGRNHQVLVTSPEIAGGKNGYSFWLGKKPAALPLFMNYAWLFSPPLREIRIEIQDIHAEKAFSLDIDFRRFLPE